MRPSQVARRQREASLSECTQLIIRKDFLTRWLPPETSPQRAGCTAEGVAPRESSGVVTLGPDSPPHDLPRQTPERSPSFIPTGKRRHQRPNPRFRQLFIAQAQWRPESLEAFKGADEARAGQGRGRGRSRGGPTRRLSAPAQRPTKVSPKAKEVRSHAAGCHR